MQAQALRALEVEGNREISADFRRHLNSHDTARSLFGVGDLAVLARSGLEVLVVQDLRLGSDNGIAALATALKERADGYALEQKCQLVTDRDPCATVASETVKKACADVAPVAAELILTGQPVPKMCGRVRLTENLLVRSSSRGGL